MEAVSIAEAKSHLSQLIHQTENGKPIYLSRHGKPVAVLVSREQYDRLTVVEESAWGAISNWRSSTSLQGQDLSDQEIGQWRDQITERPFSWDE